jgi:N-acetylneuraminic acid mutarotase
MQIDFSKQAEVGFAGRGRKVTLFSLILLVGAGFLTACSGGGSKTPPPVPAIQNVNSSTTPSSPVGLPIEINGSGFQSAPGKVVFTQNSITATVVPSSSGWTDTGLVVSVPTGNGTSNFTLPGTVSVTVVTSGGTSNAVTVNLIQMLTFNVNNVTWAQTTPLPLALSGLRAAVVPGSTSSTAYVVVTGGYDLIGNQSAVYSNTLNPDGTVGASWTSITTTSLPITLAHHAMVEADPTNSLVSTNSRFIYVLGGQQNATDSPGGLTSVYQASVDPTTGVVSNWTQLTNSSLPESLVGLAATIFNGQIYVVGGLHSDGTPSSDVFSAAVNADGSLGTWAKQTNAYATPVSFATAFGFGGKLYVIDGDPNSSTDPNAQGSTGTNAVNFASASRGTVGTWTNTATTIKSRLKHATWTAFGQVIALEGVYAGSPGSLELERTLVNSDSTLASWNGITASSNQINANVYNAAAFVSPLLSSTNTPRFLLLGGQNFTMTPPGALSNVVYYNNAP